MHDQKNNKVRLSAKNERKPTKHSLQTGRHTDQRVASNKPDVLKKDEGKQTLKERFPWLATSFQVGTKVFHILYFLNRGETHVSVQTALERTVGSHRISEEAWRYYLKNRSLHACGFHADKILVIPTPGNITTGNTVHAMKLENQKANEWDDRKIPLDTLLGKSAVILTCLDDTMTREKLAKEFFSNRNRS